MFAHFWPLLFSFFCFFLFHKKIFNFRLHTHSLPYIWEKTPEGTGLILFLRIEWKFILLYFSLCYLFICLLAKMKTLKKGNFNAFSTIFLLLLLLVFLSVEWSNKGISLIFLEKIEFIYGHTKKHPLKLCIFISCSDPYSHFSTTFTLHYLRVQPSPAGPSNVVT